jgi:hypothetical protein
MTRRTYDAVLLASAVHNDLCVSGICLARAYVPMNPAWQWPLGVTTPGRLTKQRSRAGPLLVRFARAILSNATLSPDSL